MSCQQQGDAYACQLRYSKYYIVFFLLMCSLYNNNLELRVSLLQTVFSSIVIRNETCKFTWVVLDRQVQDLSEMGTLAHWTLHFWMTLYILYSMVFTGLWLWIVYLLTLFLDFPCFQILWFWPFLRTLDYPPLLATFLITPWPAIGSFPQSHWALLWQVVHKMLQLSL